MKFRQEYGGVWGVVVIWVVTMLASIPVTVAMPGVLESGSQKWWHDWADTGQPTLATSEVNVTAVIGHTATLPCTVTNLRDRTVSWIRARDSAVMAVDRHIITTDTRFSVNHPEETEDWQLEVVGVEAGDQGAYDCQVNTHPKISTKVNLRVISKTGHGSMLDIPVSDTGVVSQLAESVASHEAEEEEAGVLVRVIGNRWVRVPSGGVLKLVCVARGKALPDLNIHRAINNHHLMSWTLNDIPVTKFWPHTNVEVRESWVEERVESELEVRGLNPSDGGTYACHAPNAAPDIVTVTVFDPHNSAGAPRVAMSEQGSWPSWGDAEPSESQASSSNVAVVSGAIILVILIVQVALCIFYIKKV